MPASGIFTSCWWKTSRECAMPCECCSRSRVITWSPRLPRPMRSSSCADRHIRPHRHGFPSRGWTHRHAGDFRRARVAGRFAQGHPRDRRHLLRGARAAGRRQPAHHQQTHQFRRNCSSSPVRWSFDLKRARFLHAPCRSGVRAPSPAPHRLGRFEHPARHAAQNYMNPGRRVCAPNTSTSYLRVATSGGSVFSGAPEKMSGCARSPT